MKLIIRVDNEYLHNGQLITERKSIKKYNEVIVKQLNILCVKCLLIILFLFNKLFFLHISHFFKILKEVIINHNSDLFLGSEMNLCS